MNITIKMNLDTGKTTLEGFDFPAQQVDGKPLCVAISEVLEKNLGEIAINCDYKPGTEAEAIAHETAWEEQEQYY